MVDPVPSPYNNDPDPISQTPDPLGTDTPTPSASSFENQPIPPMPLPEPMATPAPTPEPIPELIPTPTTITEPQPTQENLIAGTPTQSVNSFVPPPPAPLLDLTVPEAPAFTSSPAPTPAPADPSLMFRGETNFPTTETQNPGMTTATILPVGSSGQEMVSVPSSGGPRRFIIPVVIGALVFLILIAGGILYFKSKGSSNNNSTNNATVSPTPTEEVATDSAAQSVPVESTSPTDSALPTTTSYHNNEFSFTIDYPQNWVKAEATLGNVVSFTDPSSGLAPTRITVREEATTSDLNVYVTQLKKLSTQLYTGWTNINSTPTTVGTLTGTQLENTYIKGTTTVHMLQVVVIKAGKAFTISAEAEDSVFTTVKPSFTQSLASLAFSN